VEYWSDGELAVRVRASAPEFPPDMWNHSGLNTEFWLLHALQRSITPILHFCLPGFPLDPAPCFHRESNRDLPRL
jgi:hypothetical protein